MQPTNIFDKKLIPIIILFILGATALLLMQGYSKKQVLQVAEEEPSQVEIKYLAQDVLPPELPTDIPLEEGALFLRNEILTIDGGKEVQNVRMYYSKKSVKENFDIYKKYLTDNDWTIRLEENQTDFATLLAEKEDKKGNMNISISKNSITEDITVQINVVVR